MEKNIEYEQYAFQNHTGKTTKQVKISQAKMIQAWS